MLPILLLLTGVASCWGRPSASLLQSGARTASKSGSGNAALAGFQTFAEDLAAKYLEEGLLPSDAMIEQINLVIAWLDEVYGHLRDAHDMQSDDVKQCSSKNEECVPDAVTVERTVNLSTVARKYRKDHKECRITETMCANKKNEACIEYDEYRFTQEALLSQQAPCAPGHLSDTYIQADDDDIMLQQMEECLVLVKGWHDDLYEKYFACKREPPCEECTGVQNDFESLHCEWAEEHESVCRNWETCFDRNLEKCNDLCDDITVAVSARKADNETGERIKCLLLVLRDEPDSTKPAALASCTSKSYNTDEFNLTCAELVKPNVDQMDCAESVGPVSCSAEFLAAEYSGPVFEQVDHCDCHVCLALGGTMPPTCNEDSPRVASEQMKDLDTNEDGFVTLDEFMAGFMLQEQDVLMAFDPDPSGMMLEMLEDGESMEAMMMEADAMRNDMAGRKEYLETIFNEHDEDDSGTLDIQELTNLFNSLELPPASQDGDDGEDGEAEEPMLQLPSPPLPPIPSPAPPTSSPDHYLAARGVNTCLYHTVDQEQCETVAKKLVPGAQKFEVLSQSDSPFGCSVKTGGNLAVHYNTNPEGRDEVGDWSLVCVKSNWSQERRHAQFLMQATFGPTRQHMQALRNGQSEAAWVTEQLAEPVQTHREFYRIQANPMLFDPDHADAPIRLPCQAGSRWGRYRQATNTSTAVEAPHLKQMRGKAHFAILEKDLDDCSFTDPMEEYVQRMVKGCREGYKLLAEDDEDQCRYETQLLRTQNSWVTKNRFTKRENSEEVCKKTTTWPVGCHLRAVPHAVYGILNKCKQTAARGPPVNTLCSLEKTKTLPERKTVLKAHGWEWVYEPRLHLYNNTPDSPTSNRAACVRRSPINEEQCLSNQECGITCGSPGERWNNPKVGHHLPFKTHLPKLDINYDDAYRSPWGTHALAKSTVWVARALRASDQVRQRMAWALSQIVVVGAGLMSEDPELWLNFYDIMIRHALGNYRDILREVTYSPVMGRYLTHTGSSSVKFDGQFPNENYAREIMQLFSIGLVQLSEDGTVQRSEDDEPLESYDSSNILAHSRIFTGFREQPPRQNIEGHESNLIDPMWIDHELHDFYPKVSLEAGGYVGDRLPRCDDMPPDALVSMGARFQFVESSDTNAISPLVLEEGSDLYKVLCGSADGMPPCTPRVWTTLQTTLPCPEGGCPSATTHVQVAGRTFRHIAPRCISLLYASGTSTEMVVAENGDVVVAHADDKQTVFPVHWEAASPPAGTYTVEVAETHLDHLPTVDEAAAKLHIGAFPPSGSCFECEGAVKAYNGRGTTEASFDADTIFEVNGRFYKNVESTVQLNSGQVFRNPPVFLAHAHLGDASSAAGRAAEDEVEELLDHIHNHGNTAPFVAARLIQRFGVSTPPARYVGIVGNAFREGRYQEVGTGKHGDLAATVAAILLSDERLQPGQPSRDYAALREPFLKLVHVLRSLEYQDVRGLSEFNHEKIQFIPLEAFIGQFPFESPSVFNYYHADYEFLPMTEMAPEPEAEEEEEEEEEKASRKLVAPELEILTPKSMMQYLNIMNSMLHYGVAHPDCKPGKSMPLFGMEARWDGRRLCPGKDPEGRQMYQWHGDLVELDLLLTGGRLSSDMVTSVQRAYEQATTSFLVPRKFNYCAEGRTPTEEECEQVADQLALERGKKQNREELQTGSWQHVPPGCSLQTRGDWAAHYNRNPGGKNDFSYSLVCTRQAPDPLVAARLVVMTAEFNSFGEPDPLNQKRSLDQSSSEQIQRNYRAMVMLYMSGGADTYNMFVPQECSPPADQQPTEPMHEQYKRIRGGASLSTDELIGVEVERQNRSGCTRFGVHHRLPTLQRLFTANEAAIFAHIGNVAQPGAPPTDARAARAASQSWSCGRAGVFSHSDQAWRTQRGGCRSGTDSGKGIGGHIADALATSEERWVTSSFSAAGNSKFGAAHSVKQQVVGTGVGQFVEYSRWKNELENITTRVHANPYANAYTLALKDSLKVAEDMQQLFLGDALRTTWSCTSEGGLCGQFQTVAKLIGARGVRGAERDIFFTVQGGYDGHTNMKSELRSKFDVVNEALEHFEKEMKAQNVWNDVVVFSSSEFGRTLNINNRDGTDHGASGHHFIMGGAVRGGKIFNSYPQSLDLKYETRGRILPEYPWESMMYPLAKWMGVNEVFEHDLFPRLDVWKTAGDFIVKPAALFRS